MKRTRLLSLLGLILCCTCLPGPAWQRQNSLDVAFAFSDITGARALSADTPANSAVLAKAVFAGGLIRDVKFLRQQQSTADWNGRQSARTFDQARGFLFQIEGEQAPVEKEPSLGAACLLVTGQFLLERKQLSVKSDPTIRASDEVLRRVERAKGKKPEWGQSIAKIGATRELILVKFIPEGKTCLASLVLAAPDALSFADYEAEYADYAKGYVWRADTDGIDAEAFQVLATFEGKQGIEIAVIWHAAEGQSFLLLRSESGVLRELYRSYRYLAPV